MVACSNELCGLQGTCRLQAGQAGVMLPAGKVLYCCINWHWKRGKGGGHGLITVEGVLQKLEMCMVLLIMACKSSCLTKV